MPDGVTVHAIVPEIGVPAKRADLRRVSGVVGDAVDFFAVRDDAIWPLTDVGEVHFNVL